MRHLHPEFLRLPLLQLNLQNGRAPVQLYIGIGLLFQLYIDAHRIYLGELAQVCHCRKIPGRQRLNKAPFPLHRDINGIAGLHLKHLVCRSDHIFI